MIEVKNLSFKYYNTGKEVVRDVSFKVGKGESLAILGPSGCGKTTILKLLSGLLDKNDGELGGEMIRKVSSSVVFQEPTLLPWRSVKENISYPLDVKGERNEERVAELGEIMKLSSVMDELPDSLSLGMRQRVNFARALSISPELILLDEPFSALDIPTKHSIQREFLSIMSERGLSSIFITHNPEEAFYMSNKIIVLSDSPTIIKKVIDNDKVGALSERRVDEFGIY